MWQEAQYRGAFNYIWRHYIDRNKINTLKEMYKNYDELDDFERRLAKRVLYETAFSLVGLFIISSFAKADDLSNAMETRGYNPYGKRTSYRIWKFT